MCATASICGQNGWAFMPATASGGISAPSVRNSSTASPRRPSSASAASSRAEGSVRPGPVAYGGSKTASFVIGAPAAAASSASAPPEDPPNTIASPPAASISAVRSSISRWTEYGATSPLSPRPRRS